MPITALILDTAPRVETASAGSTWVAPTIVIAVLALAVSVASLFLAGRRARLDRQRKLFADAFAAAMEYREYPFIARRRNPDEVAKERQRISADLSRVQAKLNAYRAMLRVENRHVGDRYTELVADTRRVAGAIIRDAWNSEPARADNEVHNPAWDMSELEQADDAYLHAVEDHLGWLPAQLRRWQRER